MIIKSNPKQTSVCNDPTICLQLMKWLTFMYSYFISRSFYKCIICILIFRILNLPPYITIDIILCPLEYRQHYALYVSILILFVIEPISARFTIPKIGILK